MRSNALANNGRAATGVIVPGAAFVCLLLTACSTIEPRALHSRLSGVWESVEGRSDQLIIRADGTFDLRYTLWVAAGDVGKLRKAGDVLSRPDVGMRAEIVHSEFTPTLSYIVLKMTQRGEGGQCETGYGQYYARLAPDGRLLVRAGPVPAANSPPEALAEWVYQRTGDAPEPPPPLAEDELPKPTDDEWVAYGRRLYAGTNWLAKVHVRRTGGNVLNGFLITPRDEEQARVFLVVRISPKSVEGEWIKSAVAKEAFDAASAGCSILLFTIPEIEPYQRYPESRVAELADLVLADVQKVIKLVQPRGCGLETRDNGTYLGHYIWQKNNSLFGAWFCWDPDYLRWYGVSPETDLSKTALLGAYTPLSERKRRELEAVVQTYEEHGFQNVRPADLRTDELGWDLRLIQLLKTAASEARTPKE